jgi:hypothetical protein
MDLDRLKLLEQQVSVMQKEINEVLGEVQFAMEGLVKANKMAMEVIMDRLDKLENPHRTPRAIDKNPEGKEL